MITFSTLQRSMTCNQHLQVPKITYGRGRSYTRHVYHSSSSDQSSSPSVSVVRSPSYSNDVRLDPIPEERNSQSLGERELVRPVASYAYSEHFLRKCYYCGYLGDSNFYAPARGKWRPFCDNTCFQIYKKIHQW